MLSRSILFVHLLIFLSYVGLSLASPLFVWLLPWEMGWRWLAGTIIFGLVVVGSWRVWGECPFTIWENTWRKREGRRVYRVACSEYYARQLGLNVRPGVTTKILEALPFIPIAVALAKFLA
jgi:hypothetical protein